MKKPENYMSSKKPEPIEMIECWTDFEGKHQGTAWYRIADSHLSMTALSIRPHYWICSCNEHKPYSKLGGGLPSDKMKSHDKDLEMI